MEVYNLTILNNINRGGVRRCPPKENKCVKLKN